MRLRPLIASLALCAAPGAALGAPTVTCHCFRSRSFDPANPGSADAYVLAATRSSLLSAAFGVPKAALVRAVMTGTAPDDLWIAHFAAARTGRDAGWLLAAEAETGSWRAALSTEKGIPPELAAAVARGAATPELAAIAADEVVAARLGAERATIAALRAAGGGTEQVIVALFLSPALKVPALELLTRVRGGRATWGALLNEAGLAPADLEVAVRARVRDRAGTGGSPRP